MAISPPPSQPQPSPYGRDLARVILTRCEDPAFAPGGRLPNERSLAAELGVTRTLVRHALTVLEAEGRISREVGRGTFLKPGAIGSDGASESVTEVGPADVMASRRLIEPHVLPLVVAWATQRDFDEMRRCLAGGARAEDAAEFEVWDFALHHAIVAASRNPLVMVMYDVVERARKGEIWGNLKLRNDSRERRDAYQAEHVRLVDALLARDADEAVAAMEDHLQHVQANLLAATRQRSGD
ncbi:MAG TPA: FCD domain-containing protein [Solirubrobacteraceae bacterium]|nr:FCD domain-containing protein [Solirubrobacteraceae bacterium]